MPNMQELADGFERIAPLRLAEGWDNVGLLLGAPEESIDGPVILTIDVTSAVTEEAIDLGAGAVIAYHPPIFNPVSRLGDGDRLGRNLLRLARAGISVFSPHSALDAAPGGLNDWFVRGLGSGDVRALRLEASSASSGRVKIVTFVPEDEVDRVRNALASAGAGRIGDYELCSFTVSGTGSFFGREGAKPAVGEAGRLEQVSEVRLEMICPTSNEALAVETLREFHPYEEPAFDLYDLRPTPARGSGAGRRVMLDQETSASALADRLKAFLGIDRLKLAMPMGDETRPIRSVGVCVGAGGDLADAAIDAGCDVFITGEMRHHEVLSLLRRDIGVFLCGHTNTERGYLPVLRDRLAEEVPGLSFVVSRADRSPLRVV